ncbi:MAG: polysaccharide deacetylase family protein [Candidatus Dojkabacteria bacterium]|jgi:peptidoglycan/xylan/chitin deacetylase (PgdA/CDA1 family)|nr:polysaccharide deacetylase family protein [Candidatus Dojkabacteria bacterium]
MREHSKSSILLRFGLLISLLLLAFIYLFENVNPESSTVVKPTIKESIKEIQKPSYTVTTVGKDIDLPKFPQDYDLVLSTLNISLTQHQKTTLLLHGEGIVKSDQTDISSAYAYLIEKDLPTHIPQEYINIYLDSEFIKDTSYIPLQYKDIFSKSLETGTLSSNIYQEYIKDELSIYKTLPLSVTSNTIRNFPQLKDFAIDLDSESINSAYFKLRILRNTQLDKSRQITYLTTLLNDLVIYSKNSSDLNANNRLKHNLMDVIYSTDLNRSGNIYWRLVVKENKIYISPIIISEEFTINDENFNEVYDIVPTEQRGGTVRIPIIMYHQIDAMPATGSSFLKGLYVTPETFEEQLAYLVKKNYKSVTPRELYNQLSLATNPSQKSVMLTFDDSTKSQYENGYRLLKKYGLTGVFYVVTGRTSITYDQLREMANSGMIIDSHTGTHPDLTKLYDPSKLSSEIVGSRNTLIGATGQEVASIAYPGCVIDSKGYPYVKEAGYLLGVSCGRSIDHTLKNRLSLSRVHIFDSMENLKGLLSGKE